MTATNIKWEMEKNTFEDLHHIGILYTVDINEDKLKSDADGLDSEGAEWYLISNLEKNNLSPFAYYALKKLGYKLK